MEIPKQFWLIAFPFLFVGGWCFILFILSSLGGWHKLAGRFQTNLPVPKGSPFKNGKVGLVSYSRCLKIEATPDGFFLGVFSLFRVGHPMLFIPWSEVKNPRKKNFLWVERIQFEVGDPSIATMVLPKSVFNPPKLD